MKSQSLFYSLTLAVMLAAFWEMFWLDKGYKAYHDDSKDLWAEWRRVVPELEENQILIVGSSRIHFDIDLYQWEKQTGSFPVMLASVGTSPGPILKDLAERTNFKGTVIVGVAPDLFFNTEKSGGWNRLQERVDYFYKQTYAQRLNHTVFKQIDPHLAYINSHLQLEGLALELPLHQRDSVRPELIWPDMSVCDANRNLKMIPEMAADTAMQNAYKKIWSGFGWPELDTAKLDTIHLIYQSIVSKITERGGKVIFVRAPSTDEYLDAERAAFPREMYWDRLLKETNSPGIYFEDYPQLSGFDCPEWSHLLAEDAIIFTRELIEILQGEGHLIRKE